MAKIKVQLNTDDITALNNPKEREDKKAELHEAFDTCLECFEDNLCATITIDTDKDKE